jgi:Methyltransferase domain
MTDASELRELFDSLGIRREYSALDLEGFDLDLQGWGAEHPIFERVLLDVRPTVVVEVGTWKGASVLHMHSLARRHRLDTSFICIDTWLGSAEQWVKPEPRPNMQLEGGFPTLYRQFIANVIACDAVEDIFPLPISSSAGARVLDRLSVTGDVIYVDAAHEEEELALDLDLFWRVLRPGGVMFGDDYVPYWAGVVSAVDRFAEDHGLQVDVDGPKWLLRKSVRELEHAA